MEKTRKIIGLATFLRQGQTEVFGAFFVRNLGFYESKVAPGAAAGGLPRWEGFGESKLHLDGG